MAAVANQIDYDVAAEFVAVIERHPANANDGIDVFRIYMEDRNVLTASQLRCEPRRVQLAWHSSESYQIVHDDMDGSTNAVAADLCQIESFSKHALPSERAIAMDEQRKKLLLPTFTGAVLFCASAANGDGIDRLKVA